MTDAARENSVKEFCKNLLQSIPIATADDNATATEEECFTAVDQVAAAFASVLPDSKTVS